MKDQKIILKLCRKILDPQMTDKSLDTCKIITTEPVSEKLSWTDSFKNICNRDQKYAKYWFWDHFDWTHQSIWIGKFNKMNIAYHPKMIKLLLFCEN